MAWTQQCIAVLPCFNEQLGLTTLLPRVRAHLPNILVVDDGSTDATSEVARQHGSAVLPLTTNQGKGAAMRQGLEYGRKHGFTWALLMDGDGQHSPDDIPAFIAEATKGKSDLVIGNRMSDTARMPFVRRWTNRYLSYRISKLVGQSLPDTQCGFRLIRLSGLDGLNLSTTGFEIESEILTQMALARRRITFVPIATIYKSEQSKIHPVRDSLRWFRWLYSVTPSVPSGNPPAEALKPSQA